MDSLTFPPALIVAKYTDIPQLPPRTECDLEKLRFETLLWFFNLFISKAKVCLHCEETQSEMIRLLVLLQSANRSNLSSTGTYTFRNFFRVPNDVIL